MLSCESCRGQLLEYLYDLLDGVERQGIQEHVEHCPACQAALVKALAHQQLLGKAAKAEFPGVRFEAPAAPVLLPLSTPLPRRVAKRNWVGRVATSALARAAAIMLVVGALAIPAGVGAWNFSQAENLVTAQHKAIADARQKEKELNQEVAQLPGQREAEWAALEDKVREQQIRVVVSGPQTLQPGATNLYDIRTFNLNDQLVHANLDVQIVDQDRHALFFQKNLDAANGEARVTLPPDLPLKPNSKLSLEVVARRDDGQGAQATLRDELDLSPPVYFTHLTTDKPMYRPGETVYFRSLTLERFTLKPPDEDFHLAYFLRFPNNKEVEVGRGKSQVQDADNKAILGPDKKPLKGVGAGQLVLNPEDAGGEYTLVVREAFNRVPEQQRKFVVQDYELSQLNKELDFTRKTFGPGEEVTAKAKATRGDRTPVANQPVEATLNVDGKLYDLNGKVTDQPLHFQTDAGGVVLVRAKLPAVIVRGEASLSVKFIDGKSAVETITRPVPVLLKKLNVEFFPEGGYLVGGVSNRVYFQAKTPLGKPAELTGHLAGSDGQAVPGAVQTLNDAEHPGANQGMGVFSFTPRTGVRYELKIDSPTGIEGTYELPPVQDGGVTMSVPDGVSAANQPLRVVLTSAEKSRNLLVGAYCRGRLLDHQSKLVKPGEPAEVALNPTVNAGGVCRVTVFEEKATDGARKDLVPKAERLVYRQPVERLDLRVSADKKQYLPGDKVRLTLSALDENGNPAPAVVLVNVVDKNVLTLADEKTARTMPTHFYLTSEVRKPEDFEFADFLLTDNPKAQMALDLLLGTQGWRRFAEQDPAKFRNEQKAEAETLLVSIGNSVLEPKDLTLEQGKKILHKFEAKEETLRQELTETSQAEAAAKTDPAALAAQVTLTRYERGFEIFRTVGLPSLGLLLVALSVLVLLLSAAKVLPRGLSYSAAAGVCGLLILGFVLSPWAGKHPAAAGHRRLVAGDVRNAPAGLPDANFALEDAEKEAKDVKKAADFGEARGGGGPGRAFMPPPAPGAVPADKVPARAEENNKGLKLEKKNQQDLMKDGALAGKPGNANRRKDEQAALGKAEGLLKQRDELREMPRQDRAIEFEKAKDLGVDGLNRFRRPNGGFGGAAKEAMPLAGLVVPDGKRMLGIASVMPPLPPAFVVREFAHQHPASESGKRSDWAETLCWQPVLVLPDGTGQVSFDLSDSLTTFEVAVAGHTLDGRIGAVKSEIVSKLPFSLTPTIPIEVTSSDLLDIPVSITNNTSEARTVQITAKGVGLEVKDNSDVELRIDSESRTRRIFRVKPMLTAGTAELLLTGKASGFDDALQRTLRVVPDGFPINGSVSDVLEGSSTSTVMLPETWLPGTLKVNVQVYPSTLADLQKGLEAMLREPGGCFEQTSTSNYPNLLILNYLKESNQTKPEIEARARELLSRGYERLVAFECQNTAKNNQREGYEWFGGTAPAHEALTAYGLLEFRDMAKVHPVDAAMVERTKEYLMSRKDGKGGFQRNPRALDTFGRAPDDVTNAYIVWALTESGKDDDVSKELTALHDQAKTSKDPYFVSLVSLSLLNRGKADDAAPLLKTLAAAQKDDGHLDAERTSITGSGGRDLQIETTGLTILAWLKGNRPELNLNVQKAVKWIGQQRGGYGGFGSTQSTILALKALIAFAKANKKTAESGDLALYLGEQMLVKKHFEAGTQDAVVLEVPDVEKVLKPGKNDLRVEITGKNVFPYTLAWSYNTLTPASTENCPVKLTTRLDRDKANEGDAVRLTATAENVTGKGQGMAVAIIGLPAGLTLPESLEQLKKYAKTPDDGSRPLVSYFELRGRELVLYWRDMAPGQKIEVPIDLNCRVPGEYRGPASRAYLYYNADAKCWVEPIKVTILAKGE